MQQKQLPLEDLSSLVSPAILVSHADTWIGRDREFGVSKTISSKKCPSAECFIGTVHSCAQSNYSCQLASNLDSNPSKGSLRISNDFNGPLEWLDFTQAGGSINMDSGELDTIAPIGNCTTKSQPISLQFE